MPTSTRHDFLQSLPRMTGLSEETHLILRGCHKQRCITQLYKERQRVQDNITNIDMAIRMFRQLKEEA